MIPLRHRIAYFVGRKDFLTVSQKYRRLVALTTSPPTFTRRVNWYASYGAVPMPDMPWSLLLPLPTNEAVLESIKILGHGRRRFTDVLLCARVKTDSGLQLLLSKPAWLTPLMSCVGRSV